MTQATAVAVHFYSLLMTWGQAGSREHKQYRLPYWGLGLGGCEYACAHTHVCVYFGWVWLNALEMLNSERKSYPGIRRENRSNELCHTF